MSQKELRRGVVLGLVAGGQWTLVRGAEEMGLTVRQARRLLRRYELGGPSSLAHGSRGKPAANRISDEVRQRVLSLAAETYVGFNDTHLQEALAEREGIVISRVTLRRLLRQSGRPPKRKRRPRQHRRRREPRERRGEMVQWDGSIHPWIATGPKWTLLAAVDDADGRAVWALFAPTESSVGYFQLLAGVIRQAGIPSSVYHDQHGALRRTDGHWSLEEQLRGEQDPTQIGAALRDLGIRSILARSAQGKGRIERFFGVAQDRLVAELALRRIRTLDEANDYLQKEWLDDFNRRFASEAAQSESLYRRPGRLDLEKILAFRYDRVVAADNTVKLGDLLLQIPPGPRHRSFAQARVDIRQHLDGSWSVYHQDRRIAHLPATPLREPWRTRLKTTKTRAARGAHETLLVYFQEAV